MLKIDTNVILLLNLLAIAIQKSTNILETLQSLHPSTLFHDSSPINCDDEKANLFNNYFYSIFTKTPSCMVSSNDYPTVLSSITITEEEVYDTLVSLDTTKAMGPDGIPPIVLFKINVPLSHTDHFIICFA